MIQPLRRAHYRVIIGAAIVLPIILLLGLLARRPFPQEELQFQQLNDWHEAFKARIMPFKKILAPDLLVYWSPVIPAGQGLLLQARLLGSLHGSFARGVSLPSDGYFLLFSLAHQKVVAAVPVDRKEKQP